MAIINEINGDLENAASWARKAYTDFRIKRGLRYARLLENRQYDEDLVKYQEKR